MSSLAERVASATGWRRRGIAICAGLAGALILAPIDLGFALLVPMSITVWLLDGTCAGAASSSRRARRAFADGWWLGFGYHLAGFWWLGAAFLVDRDVLFLMPLGVLGVPALLALFTGGGLVLAQILWRPGPARVLALATGLAAAEWARSHWFSGFPWNTFGMALGGRLVTAQLASLCGQDGLNIVAVALAAAPATLADRGHRRWVPTVVAAVVLCGIAGFGLARLRQAPPPDVPGVVIRLVQPGLRPDEAFTYENKNAIVDRYLELSRQVDAGRGIGLPGVTMLVWPESPFPFILTREPALMARMVALLPARTALVTGAAREVDVPAEDGRTAHSDYFNAILVITHGGGIIGAYDKVHLVPFGEYLPFDSLLRRLGLRNFVAIPGGFEAGPTHHPLDVPGLPPAAPLICYEAIFPAELAGGAARPRYLLNITNDGWFGVTSGPWQHLAQARLRTIEEGLPMVRGAATGISAFIDADGRVRSALPLGGAGILDGPLPGVRPPPPYTRFPRIAILILTFNMLLLFCLQRRRPISSYF